MSVQEPDDTPGAQILLIEDSEADAELSLIAIRQARPEVVVHVVTSGDEALAFLQREGEHADAPRPDLILLDLNLPGRDGIEIASIVKADDDLMVIPVVMFSNSDAGSDIRAAYRSGVNAYLAKPMEYADIKQAVATLLDFWLHWVCSPSAAATGQRR